MKEMIGAIDGYKSNIGFVAGALLLIAASAGWIDTHTAGVLGGFVTAFTGISIRQAIAKAHAAAEDAASKIDEAQSPLGG